MKRRTQRRLYDVSDLAILMIGDIEIDLRPYQISPEMTLKIHYWLGRAYDAGWAAVKMVEDEDGKKGD